jgi:TATA-box binding protein (TBP) (component of TFIID and TFIIIB)
MEERKENINILDDNTNIIIGELKKKLKIDTIPEETVISTMTLISKIPVKFYVMNIARYIDLTEDKILSIFCGSSANQDTNRTVLKKVIRKSKKNKQKTKSFFNQVTIEVRTKTKIINVKLFINGSIQLTGCKSINDMYEALNILFQEFRNEKAVIENNKIIERPYVDNLENLDINKLYDCQIALINSDIKLHFNIDREKLYNIMLEDKISCEYDPLIYAGVKVRYNYNNDKIISIFIFESGSVIITGSTTSDQLTKAHSFIMKYLIKNYRYIVIS